MCAQFYGQWCLSQEPECPCKKPEGPEGGIGRTGAPAALPPKGSGTAPTPGFVETGDDFLVGNRIKSTPLSCSQSCPLSLH